LSIDEFNLEKEVLIFPNPSKDGVFNINTSQVIEKVEVYNTMGQLINKNVLTTQNSFQLSKLYSGIYFITVYVKDDQAVFTKKVIVE